MTDRTKSWGEMAADCAIDAAHATDHDEAMKWIGLSVANALLAIRDTLADKHDTRLLEIEMTLGDIDLDQPHSRRLNDLAARLHTLEQAAEARQRAEASPAVTPSTDATVSQSESDPLDEDDHRDRVDRDGDLLFRNPGGCWHTCQRGCRHSCGSTLAGLDSRFGPLAFAPDAASDAPRADLSASQGESGDEGGGEAKETAEPLLCVECEHLIDYHTRSRCEIVRCPCTLRPSDIARKLIEQAVAQATGADRPVTLPEGWTLTGSMLSHRERGHVGWVLHNPSDNSWLAIPLLASIPPRQLLDTKQAAVNWIIEQVGGGRG